ncbi:ribonuclease P protein component [Xanthobacter sp. V4C-4]|uniref:ribonuclease P protein component n=1 Tax=Xanthobacter cornucopiae TaxID=3119924 RepID=UPI00372AA121
MDKLRKRRDFLAAAKAERAGVSAFLLQGRDRGDDGQVRIGFTVTKKTGNAVVRNRIRRRLREVARKVVPGAGRAGYDYVMIAREQALHAAFDTLLSDLARALRKLHDPPRSHRAPSGRRPPKTPARDTAGAPDTGTATDGAANSRYPGPRKRGTGSAGAEGQDAATRRGPAAPTDAAAPGDALHPDQRISSDPQSDPQAPSADGGHPA